MKFVALEESIGVKFKNLDLLNGAFVHRSFLNESQNAISNERMEFLGDAVLELVTTEYLFKNYPQYDEGMLTSLRSALVRGLNLAEIAVKLDLGQYLTLSKGEENSGGRTKPYILANTFEALIGAIYLDQGIEISEKFIHKFVLTTLEQIIAEGLYLDAKTFFQEKSQEILGVTPKYELISEEGPDHEKIFVMRAMIAGEEVGTGSGKNKQEAEEASARNAIKLKGWIGKKD